MKKKPSFHIFYRDGFAWLTVYPQEAGDPPVYPEDIEGRLKLLGIRKVRRQLLISAIEKQDGIPEKLIPWPDGRKLSPDISVKISEDRMNATVKVTPGRQGGEPLSSGMIISALKEAGITFGIDTDAVERIVREHIYYKEITVASGIYPVDQKSSYAEFMFETDRGKPFRELDFGRIDLKELNFIQNVEKGDVLAVIHDAVPPVPGKDIFSNTIPAQSGEKTAAVKPGKGSLWDDTGKKIIAGIKGNVKLSGNTVVVEPLITVEDVNYANGNMDFNGAIDIRGRIADRFIIKAAGDIQIGKSVSRVNISGGGDIILKAGISGNDEGEIFCRGDLYARYIENADITCMGNIYVEEAIMHSRVKAGENIFLTGKRAEIFGGTIVAGGNIKCKKLGNINEPPTEIHMGISTDNYTALVSLQNAVRSAAEKLDSIEIKTDQLTKAAKTGTDAETMEKIRKAIRQLELDKEKVSAIHREKLRELHSLERSIKIRDNVRLQVEERVFAKVSVYFGSNKWAPTHQGTSRTMLSFRNGKITEEGF